MRDTVRLDRRAFLQALALGAIAGSPLPAATPRTSMYLAFTSFAVRLAGNRGSTDRSNAFDARALLQQCDQFGARGAQVDLSQLPVDDAQALASIARDFERHGIELELALPAGSLENEHAYARAVEIGARLGARRARVALLNGRRYETFDTKAAWDAFALRWRTTLLGMRAVFNRHRFLIGIENHKDFTSAELASLLAHIDSPYVGACVDFGNNLALLDDPDETIDRLAPYAVTTHVKDMAVRTIADGFELSEVPLGQGLLPLDRYVRTIRGVKPEATFCLEMLTRDPLVVPYRTERYWAPFDEAARSRDRIRHFETHVLSKAWTRPLPRIGAAGPEAQIAAEDANVRTSLAYARDTLKLTM